ncbi:MAG: hypothetical protein QM680_07345 [Luteolibacter sp.]
MAENDKLPEALVTLGNFKKALKSLRDTKTLYCVVGGLAVGQWGEEFLKPEEKFRFDLPIRSKDLDIRAQKDAAVILVLNLRNEGASASQLVMRNPKNRDASFPSCAVSVVLSDPQPLNTTIEALSGMPLLDEYDSNHNIRQNGSALLYRDLYLLDPCSLLICKLNAIHTRPPGESDNDRKHATILSLVIPRFIQRTIQRLNEGRDRYHPFADANRLAGFLTREPWSGLLPADEKERVLQACKLAEQDKENRENPPPVL